MMPNDVWIELYLWANGAKITYLEIAPFEGSYPPARLPVLESIKASPQSGIYFQEQEPSANRQESRLIGAH